MKSSSGSPAQWLNSLSKSANGVKAKNNFSSDYILNKAQTGVRNKFSRPSLANHTQNNSVDDESPESMVLPDTGNILPFFL